MVRFIPKLHSCSASVKEEKKFETLHEMERYVLNQLKHIRHYVGLKELIYSDIVISENEHDDEIFGLRNMRKIYAKGNFIGVCGE